MLGRMLLAATLVAALLSGCFGGDRTDDDAGADAVQPGRPGYLYDGPGTLFAGPALYEDPQNTPHPAYNWPTLSHPAVGPGVPALWKPNQATDLPMEITELVHVVQAPGVTTGAGIALFGSLAIVPSYSTQTPSSIVDISDPNAPEVLSTFPTQLNGHRGATVIAYPTGRLVTVISTDGGLDVWDITDPRDPQPLPPIDDIPSHKVGVVPGTPIVYNARSDGGSGSPYLLPGPAHLDPSQGTGIIDMFDFSDPEEPAKLPDFENGFGCHHVYFWNNLTEEKFRSVCAGIEYTQIFDTTDPSNPSIIVSVPYGLGRTDLPSQSASLAAFAHYAGISRDGTILMVGDESGGGLGPVGCVARVDTPAGAVSVPIGAVWFYDISDETDPQYLGHVSASQLERFMSDDPSDLPEVDPSDPRGTVLGAALGETSCTAHHGRLVPVDGDVLAMSFYGAGVLVIDFSDIRNEGTGLPTVVAQYAGPGANVWETWYYNGHLYTGDMGRGMDILDLE